MLVPIPGEQPRSQRTNQPTNQPANQPPAATVSRTGGKFEASHRALRTVEKTQFNLMDINLERNCLNKKNTHIHGTNIFYVVLTLVGISQHRF